MKVSIVIPVYNEALAIKETLRRVVAAPLPAGMTKELVIIDDGSKDRTAIRIQEFINENKHDSVEIIFHRVLINHGKGSALRAGFEILTGELVIVQDGDLEYDPNDYIQLLEKFKHKHINVVFGTRFHNGVPKGMKLPNAIANLLLTYAVRIIYGQKITDEATGFKVFRSEVLKKIELECRRFEFCPEFVGKISRAGYKIVEVPISYNPRGILEGKKIKATDGFIAIWWLIKTRFTPLKRAENQLTPAAQGIN